MTKRRPIGRLLTIVLLLLWTAVALAQPAKLGRERLDKYWGEPRKPSATAVDRVNKALERAKVPEGSAAWMALAENYSRLDHEAAAEPAAYEGSDKEAKAAWFTHGMPHLLDILHLAMENEDFVKDVWATQGVKGDAAEQAYRDLLLAIIGHDSQQRDFASADKEKREAARLNHALEGGVQTAKAYKLASGDNAQSVTRQLALGLAAAGHSKTAVDLSDPVKVKAVVETLATKLGVTVNDAQIADVIAQAKPVASMLGALDALRDRGKGGFGHTTAPCGENMIYRVRETGTPAIEVYNTKTEKVLRAFEGIDHRTYVEVHTKVDLLQLEKSRLQITIDFEDARISNTARKSQIDDIGLDMKRVGLSVDITWTKNGGGWEKTTYNP